MYAWCGERKIHKRVTHLKATYRCRPIAGEVKPFINRTPHHFRHRIAAVEPHLDLPLVKAAGLDVVDV